MTLDIILGGVTGQLQSLDVSSQKSSLAAEFIWKNIFMERRELVGASYPTGNSSFSNVLFLGLGVSFQKYLFEYTQSIWTSLLLFHQIPLKALFINRMINK